MKVKDISVPVSSLKGVGEATAKLFANLNIHTIGDLLTFWPYRWEDHTKLIPLSQFRNAKINTAAKVLSHEWFGYGAMSTLKINITDGTENASLICFNRPFLKNSLPEGSIIRVSGSFTIKYNSLQSSSFDAVQILPAAQSNSISQKFNPSDYLKGETVVPVYHLTEGLTQNAVRKTIRKAFKEYAKGIQNEIPEDVIQRQSLCSKIDCIKNMHMPEKIEDAEKAKLSLIFEELYNFQTAIAKRALERRGKLPILEDTLISKDLVSSEKKETELNISEIKKTFILSLSPKQKKLAESLPFELTADQMKVIQEMNVDIDNSYISSTEKKSISMARLLQGDVGSGKTLAAFFACLRTADYGGQSALLAPTELLAKQHAENAAKMLDCTGIRLAFLTGNIKKAGRTNLLSALKNGEIDIIIGTHALFSQNVKYKDLRLAVIDEQHRFGVVQRNAIIEKGRKQISDDIYITPNLLMMSATPIPQTLALSVFGDLDISTIHTMPSGRKPIKTHLTKQGNESNVYAYVRKELNDGRQAYFVYPLIETNEEFSVDTDTNHALKSAEEMASFLQKTVFPEYKVGLIHSKIDEDEQQNIMKDFKDNKIQILAATSVVEVGVDVANATCMVIEHAERFGLAALHQLRGRVGRSSLQSHCFLIYSNKLSEAGKARLKALFESTDGFFIAEQDLELRGPGEVLGTQQSGYLALSIADPVRDYKIMQVARQEAFSHIKQD